MGLQIRNSRQVKFQSHLEFVVLQSNSGSVCDISGCNGKYAMALFLGILACNITARVIDELKIWAFSCWIP